MIPPLLDEFEFGRINIKVYRVGEDLKFWVRAGAALIELHEDDLFDLKALLDAILEGETKDG